MKTYRRIGALAVAAVGRRRAACRRRAGQAAAATAVGSGSGCHPPAAGAHGQGTCRLERLGACLLRAAAGNRPLAAPHRGRIHGRFLADRNPTLWSERWSPGVACGSLRRESFCIWRRRLPDAAVEITTRQGQFRLALADLTPGRPLLFLKGAAEAERIADTQDLVVTPDEEDFPSAATTAEGTVYLAYLAFTPGPHFGAGRTPPGAKLPKNHSPYPFSAAIWSSQLSEVAEPTGGDRVWLLDAQELSVEQAHCDHRWRRGSLSHGHRGGWTTAGMDLLLEETSTLDRI